MRKCLEQSPRLYDFAPERQQFRSDVLHGLQTRQKELPSKYFYDDQGSQLFEQICEQDEYYLTRTELGIMRERAREMAELLGPRCLLIEYGSGSSTKTRLLLDALQDPAGYVPIDISKGQLLASVGALAMVYPDLEVLPVCADYTKSFDLPAPRKTPARRVAYFPGSTIGNFEQAAARRFLRQVAAVCRSGGGLLIGVDLHKDFTILHRAYNDAQGITAQFNKHLLERINRELGANFQLQNFGHYAFYNPHRSRVEMHLVSLQKQTVRVDQAEIAFKRGESIWTESSYKYALDDFARLATGQGFTVERVWTDPRELFSVQYLSVHS
ncbi:MAG TPA: L-histidine N(alpha)-methyltransferase [Ktedonobacteraceae bacterium]